jgi:hypothetical protein
MNGMTLMSDIEENGYESLTPLYVPSQLSLHVQNGNSFEGKSKNIQYFVTY